jgi:hypothetical protein
MYHVVYIIHSLYIYMCVCVCIGPAQGLLRDAQRHARRRLLVQVLALVMMQLHTVLYYFIEYYI